MKEKISQILDDFLRNKGVKVEYVVEYPKSEKFGDYATNIAMALASVFKKNPKNIAKEIIDFIGCNELFEKIEIAGAGFINFFINRDAFLKELKVIYEKRDDYFRPSVEKRYVQVEFVSANPTGPLHIGHGRGAAIGDSIARILKFSNHRVEKEYYINDAGLQMHLLGLSTFVRYKQLLGYDEPLPEDGYKGEYLIDIAKDLMVQYGDSLLFKDEDEAIEICKEKAADVILKDIMAVLDKFRVKFDKIFNESKLYKQEMEESLDYLKEKGLIYEKDGALWFKSTQFGDEKDRVVRRSNGAFTYFASDIAYHRNKFLKRKFDKVIDVWGADHHGYVKRVKSAIEAFGVNPDRLRVVLVQIVNLLRDGKKVSMSTRKAEFVELEDVIDEVGVDAARFMFISRSVDSHLDFDLELVKKESSENPVYYVQYAYARINSIFSQLDDFDLSSLEELKLNEKEEIDLIKSLIMFKELIRKAHDEIEPYFVVKGVLNIAEKLHKFYNKHRVIGSEEKIMLSRLFLLESVKTALKLGFDLIGVEAKKRM
ncbi:arginine--tRNA ligase [Hippea alviniae]|uniref:arginine--tRNA ligase n=1 Tax=Hippea alviniae TaxID=1279027 RepID=UPI0003B4C6AD|nr:arginine--tRNA ligase [Hippea alviniae]